MPNALPPAAAYQHAYEARQRAGGQAVRRATAPAAPRRPRADERSAVVVTANEWWSVLGEFTTPAPGRYPAFIAGSIRLIHEDGRESDELIDLMSAASIKQFEELAIEYLTEGN